MSDNDSETKPAGHKVGLFDIRIIIGSLVGIYGVILLLTGLFTSDKQIDKSDGLNINIVAGICMIIAAVAFGIWARLRPIVVPDDPDAIKKDDSPPVAH